jgi:predicted flap endonuclease-1-like 5' DNA nuclease
MTGLTIFMLVFFAILAIGTIAVCLNLNYKRKDEIRQLLTDKETVKIQYDQARKEKIDLEEKANNAIAQERTFKVAYEDWKSKYEILESKYIQIRKEIEQINANNATSKLIANEATPVKLEEKTSTLESTFAQKNEVLPYSNQENTSVIQELKQILNQHMQIISGMINDEKSVQKLFEPPIQIDPLMLIDGINEEIFAELKEIGVHTFSQIAEATRKDIKKWIFHFEEIDENIIESWPFQAKAIINFQNKNSVSEA